GNNQKVLFEVNYSFYRYRLWCRNAVESWKDSKVVEYRPYAFTGFNRNRAVTVGYGCKTAYNGSLSNELWVSRSNTTTIGGEFSLIGLSLNAQQKHTDSHKKYYTPTRSGARICGENNYPALTEKVREGVY